VRISAIIVSLSLVLVTTSGCLKNETCKPNSVATDAPTIQAYASQNGIAATNHPSGVYYEILDPGTGETPTASSLIFIRYTGKLLDGTIFDQRSDETQTGWPLSGLIEGWKIGLPLIKEGGHIRLLVPSALAYGCSTYGTIPGNSVLDFDIELVSIQ
jgi:FKBP-type peptidyl-prolyl cis-trans isomerase FkpA